MKSAWPTVQEITDRITATGNTVPGTLSIADLRGAAIAWWENQTRFYPFLVTDDSEPQTRTYHEAQNGDLFFGCGFCSDEALSIEIDGTTEELDTDYVLRRDSGNTGGPYTWAQLLSGVGHSFGIIEVSGVVGWGTSIPEDAWEAVLCKAMLPALNVIQAGRNKGIGEIGIGSGDLRVKFADYGTTFISESKDIEKLAKKYRLKSL